MHVAGRRALNSKQIQQAKHYLTRDSAELIRFRSTFETIRTGISSVQMKTATHHFKIILSDMQREIEQNKKKVVQAKIEKAGSKSELRSDRRELRRERSDDDRYEQGRDRRNKRDDRQDFYDDIGDSVARTKIVEQQQRIRNNFLGYTSLFQKSDYPNQLSLLSSFIVLMEKDIELTRIELKEDTIEKVEDRRETRDDRRNRRWN